MVKMPEKTRMVIEKNVDGVIDRPDLAESACRRILIAQGIEPDLERILSYFLGMIFGQATMVFNLEKGRDPTIEEYLEISRLLKRRTYEMREAILGTRIEE